MYEVLFSLISSGSRKHLHINGPLWNTYMTLGDLLLRRRFVLTRRNIPSFVRREACWVSQDAVSRVPLPKNQEARVGVTNFRLEKIIALVSYWALRGIFEFHTKTSIAKWVFRVFSSGNFLSQLSHFYSIFLFDTHAKEAQTQEIGIKNLSRL